MTTFLDATTNRILPQLDKCAVVYEMPALWPQEVPINQRWQTPPTDEKLQAIVDRANAAGQIVLDIESFPLGLSIWGNQPNEQTKFAARQAFCDIIDRLRGLGMTADVGAYDIGAPQYSLQNPQASRADAELVASEAGSIGANTMGIMDRLDFVAPELYARGDTTAEQWETRANLIHNFCLRWERPIRPFIWPQYHDHHLTPSLRLELLPFFGDIIRFCQTHVSIDQVFIWGMNSTPTELDWIKQLRERVLES